MAGVAVGTAMELHTRRKQEILGKDFGRFYGILILKSSPFT
jgi:hypothetical protein